jgi:hypothetical protein
VPEEEQDADLAIELPGIGESLSERRDFSPNSLLDFERQSGHVSPVMYVPLRVYRKTLYFSDVVACFRHCHRRTPKGDWTGWRKSAFLTIPPTGRRVRSVYDVMDKITNSGELLPQTGGGHGLPLLYACVDNLIEKRNTHESSFSAGEQGREKRRESHSGLEPVG